MAGSVVALKSDRHRSLVSWSQEGSGGFTWKHAGASGSYAPVHDIIAIAYRLDGGAGPTRQVPPSSGRRPRSVVKVLSSSTRRRAAADMPSPSLRAPRPT